MAALGARLHKPAHNAIRESLADFLQKPHMDMLTEKYSRAQANSIASYILTLRRK